MPTETDRARVQEYYSAFSEWGRLESPAGRVEFERALQLLDQYLPAASRVLDIGGGPGRYAIELARRGHRVVLADPSPVLLAQGRERIAGSDIKRQVESIDEAGAEDHCKARSVVLEKLAAEEAVIGNGQGAARKRPSNSVVSADVALPSLGTTQQNASR